MNITEELEKFTAHAKEQGMDLAGDVLRFENLETAIAWTKWYDEALGVEGSDSAIEREILAKGLTAPRITPADIEANIASVWFINGGTGSVPDGFQPPVPAAHPLRLLTFCVLVLKNGFTVTGESACASPENFDAEIGRAIARENAVQKIWPLMGYQLKEHLFQRTQPAHAPE